MTTTIAFPSARKLIRFGMSFQKFEGFYKSRSGHGKSAALPGTLNRGPTSNVRHSLPSTRVWTSISKRYNRKCTKILHFCAFQNSTKRTLRVTVLCFYSQSQVMIKHSIPASVTVFGKISGWERAYGSCVTTLQNSTSKSLIWVFSFQISFLTRESST